MRISPKDETHVLNENIDIQFIVANQKYQTFSIYHKVLLYTIAVLFDFAQLVIYLTVVAPSIITKLVVFLLDKGIMLIPGLGLIGKLATMGVSAGVDKITEEAIKVAAYVNFEMQVWATGLFMIIFLFIFHNKTSARLRRYLRKKITKSVIRRTLARIGVTTIFKFIPFISIIPFNTINIALTIRAFKKLDQKINESRQRLRIKLSELNSLTAPTAKYKEQSGTI